MHRKRIERALIALALVGAVGLLAAGLAIRAGDIHLQVVLSGSMQPTFSAGDVAITQAIPVDAIAVGDIVAFYPPGQGQPVLHRITSLQMGSGAPTITTRGDANNVDDTWHATLRGPTAYRLVLVLPFIGWLAQLRGLALIAGGLLVALVLLRELRRKEPVTSGPSPVS